MVLVKKWPFFHVFFFQAIQTTKICFTIFQNKKTPFQPLKSTRSKSRKIEIFAKAIVLVKKWPFFHVFFFQAIQARKMCFTIFQNKETPFQPIKTTGSKSRKIGIFPKGLTHGFGQKMAIFPCLFFRQYRPGKCVLQYCRTKKRLCRL